MFPAPGSIAVEHTDTVRDGEFLLGRSDKGESFVGIRDRNISTDDGCDLVVGNPSDKVKNGAWEVGVYAIPMVSAIKTLVAPYRFIKTDALFVGFACLVGTPRQFVCLRNNDSSFLKNFRVKNECRVGRTRRG